MSQGKWEKKLINVFHHINRERKKNYMNIPVNSDKHFCF